MKTPRDGRRLVRSAGPALLLAATAWLAGGCGAQGWLLGASGETLFQGFDVLCQGGEKVELVAKIQGGNYLRGVESRTVDFYRGGASLGSAVTDGDGFARIAFQAPPDAGDVGIVARLRSADGEDAPDEAPILVAVRGRDAPILVTDLDETVVADGFRQVLLSDPRPMDDSARVLSRCRDAGLTVVYLTHRPDYFNKKSKDWLANHGFPRGPLLVSDVSGFLSGSGAFKTAKLGELMKRFPEVRVGIGDKISDAQAYCDNGIRTSIRIMTPAEKAKDLREQADDLDSLDASVHVVTDWKQVEKVLFDGARYPRPAMQATLRELADRTD